MGLLSYWLLDAEAGIAAGITAAFVEEAPDCGAAAGGSAAGGGVGMG